MSFESHNNLVIRVGESALMFQRSGKRQKRMSFWIVFLIRVPFQQEPLFLKFQTCRITETNVNLKQPKLFWVTWKGIEQKDWKKLITAPEILFVETKFPNKETNHQNVPIFRIDDIVAFNKKGNKKVDILYLLCWKWPRHSEALIMEGLQHCHKLMMRYMFEYSTRININFDCRVFSQNCK